MSVFKIEVTRDSSSQIAELCEAHGVDGFIGYHIEGNLDPRMNDFVRVDLGPLGNFSVLRRACKVFQDLTPDLRLSQQRGKS